MLYPQDPAIRVQRTDHTLIVSWKRNLSEGFLLLALGVVLGAAGFAAASTPLKSGAERLGSERAWILAITFLMALPLIYFGTAYLVNRVQIRADRSRVARLFGPMACSKRFSVPTDGIQQFFAVVSSVDRSSLGMSGGSVYLMDAQGQVHPLARGLPSSFAANQVCHELEDFYGIEDKPVFGVTTDPSHPGPRPA